MEIEPSILITGASGNVGKSVVEELEKLNIDFIIGSVNNETETKHLIRKLDFTNPSTFDSALQGVKQVFLMRPPALANVKKYFEPFLDKCKEGGVEHIVFLSLQGVESNSMTPHHKIEKYIKEIGIPYTFVRPSFFMQNLTTTHLNEIKNGEIYVPAGKGKTSFIDTRDIGVVIAKIIKEKDQHINKSYEITGSESFSYYEIADILSKKIDKQIIYKNPNPVSFVLKQVERGTKIEFAIVMLALYSVAKLGKADNNTQVFKELMGRDPITFEKFVEDNKGLFI